MTLSQFFFFYNATVIIVTALLMVTRKSPVHSVIVMLVMFFHIAGLYLFLNAEFVAALQVVVYAGAILVLFLFVIFLLNLKPGHLEQNSIANWPTAAVLSIAMFAAFAMATKGIQAGPGKYSIEQLNSSFGIEGTSHIKAVGVLLYTQYIFPFEAASLILLVAMVGAIVLAKNNS
ncbi:NADH-quinone oxidoreductase subunit J [Nitrospirota bacterium]